MAFYRGKELQPEDTELQEIIDKEANMTSLTTSSHSFGLLTVLTSPDFLRPFKCVGVIKILMGLSGFTIIPTYTASFFEEW